MRRTIALFFLMMATSMATAAEVDGLITRSSPYGVGETLDRLEKILESKGITVALRWDHGGNAGNAGIDMRETEVLIFGNPKLGSHLMTSAQSAGIDLPMKALAWRDGQGEVWLAYNDPAYVARRHGVDDRSDIINKMSQALENLTQAAVSAE